MNTNGNGLSLFLHNCAQIAMAYSITRKRYYECSEKNHKALESLFDEINEKSADGIFSYNANERQRIRSLPLT